MKPTQANPVPPAPPAPKSWSKERVARYALVGLGLPGLFLGTGWLFLSTVDGWGGILLWVLFSLPLCFFAEFLLRQHQRRREVRSERSLPRMRIRTPARGDVDRARASLRGTQPEFQWHRDDVEDRRRRRTPAGR